VDHPIDPPPGPLPTQQARYLKIALFIGFFLILVWIAYSTPENGQANRDAGRDLPPPPARTSLPTHADGEPASKPAAESDAKDLDSIGSYIVHNVRITNESGRVVYRGDIDLKPTLDRIERGKRLRFSHDGIVFENREKRLPARPAGYYREFVHPTSGEDGPGGQRVVMGREGEVYYSPDHYRTFRRVH
jgi:filamentous hemagglutinin